MRTNHLAAAFVLALAAFQLPASAQKVPTFKVDPSWPQEMPNNWIMSVVTGVFVDAKQHVWVTNLPEQLIKDMKTAKEQGWGKLTPVLPALPGEPY